MVQWGLPQGLENCLDYGQRSHLHSYTPRQWCGLDFGDAIRIPLGDREGGRVTHALAVVAERQPLWTHKPSFRGPYEIPRTPFVFLPVLHVVTLDNSIFNP